MKIVDKIIHPGEAVFSMGMRGGFRFLDDESYLKMMYRCRFGKKLDLQHPKTFNEKIQWLKLHNRDPLYTKLVDKYEVKKYVADKIGEEYIIPTLGIWDSFDDIDFHSLPGQFVLKCTHDSGGVVICRDKENLDMGAARKKICRSLKRNYYWAGREWPYKNVKPRIIAEKYLEDKSEYGLKDYKFFCFDALVKALFVATDRMNQKTETKFDFFDAEFRRLPLKNGHPNGEEPVRCPESFGQMKKLVEMIARDIPHARVDFYDVDGRIYFGEITFYHWSGLVPFEPEKWDTIFGEWIRIPDGSGGGILTGPEGNMLYVHGGDKLIQEKNRNGSDSLTDYKFYCFHGIPAFFYISEGLENHKTARISFLETNWEKAAFQRRDYLPFEKIPDQPENFDDMKKIAGELAEGFPFLRVDLYSVSGQVYFSEITFYPCSGFMLFSPETADEKVGNHLVGMFE